MPGAAGRLNAWSLEATYGEPSARTGPDGRYSFERLGPGTYTVRHEAASGLGYTLPAEGAYQVEILSDDSARSGIDFLVSEDADRDGVADSHDCAPADSSRWRSAAYADADRDGVRDSPALLQVECYGAQAQAGFTTSQGGLTTAPRRRIRIRATRTETAPGTRATSV